MLHGTGFVLDPGDGKQARGFYRTVYVLAVDAASAIRRAKEQQLSTLHTGEYAESAGGISEANLAVEAIEETWAYWKLLRPEGHIFYTDEDEHQTDKDDLERKPS
jgi:hypothetical protein